MKTDALCLLVMLTTAGAACVPDPAAQYNVNVTLKPPTPEATGSHDAAAAPDADDEVTELDGGDDSGQEAQSSASAPVSGSGGVTGSGGSPEGPAALDAAGDSAADAAPDGPAPDLRADTRDTRAASDVVVVAKECSEVFCPALFEVARACNAHESTCRSEVASAAGAPVTVTRYCHANGVKKVARSSFTGQTYRTALEVLAPGGRGCYELEMSTHAGSPIEHWRFRLWSGDVLARGSWNPSNGKTYLTCAGVTYDVTATDCPGTDGEPGPGECSSGSCK